jgi:hypothetical protein
MYSIYENIIIIFMNLFKKIENKKIKRKENFEKKKREATNSPHA